MTPRLSSSIALALCAVAAAFSGCSTDPVPMQHDTVSSKAYPQIEVEPQLKEWLRFDDPRITRDTVLRVTVPVRLASENQEATVQYEFQFFDARGQLLQPVAQPRRITLPTRRQVFFEGAALDNRAVEWRLYVRSAR